MLKSLEEEKYSQGYLLYEQGLFNNATFKFFELALINPFEKKYWFALASSLQQEEKYVEAINAWEMAASLDWDNPLVHFHFAECLLSVKKKNEALQAIDFAEKKCDNEILLEKIKNLKHQNS